MAGQCRGGRTLSQLSSDNGAMIGEGRFAAVITCMDGRIQTRTLDQVMTRFGVRYVDNITATGAVQHLDGSVTPTGEGLLQSLTVSARAHGTNQVALVAHTGCAGNPVPDDKQKRQLQAARVVVAERFPEMEVVALFFDPRIGFEKVG
jgi:carbonic anhydrase